MTIASWGTGRKDYSDNVEYTVQPETRSHLRRIAYNFTIIPSHGYVSYDWGYLYETAIYIGGQTRDQIIADGVRAGLSESTAAAFADLYRETIPIHVYEYTLESASNNLVVLALYEYPDFYNAVLGTNSTCLGYTMSFKKAKLRWTNGMVINDKTYNVGFNVVMDYTYPSSWPSYSLLDIVGTLTGVEEEVVYG